MGSGGAKGGGGAFNPYDLEIVPHKQAGHLAGYAIHVVRGVLTLKTTRGRTSTPEFFCNEDS